MHIQRERRIGPPLEDLLTDVQEPIGIRQGASQMVDLLAQVGVRLSFGRIAPEQVGKLGARLGRVAMQYEVRQERLQPRVVDAGHRRGAV